MALLYAKASDGYLASIPVNVMGFTQSLLNSGYCKFPSNLLYQWGELTWDNAVFEGTKTLTHPLSFSIIYSSIGILIANASFDSNSDTALNLVSSTITNITFQVQMDSGDQHSMGIEYSSIGSA